MKLVARSHEPGQAPSGRPQADSSGTRRDRSRGQVLVIFAGASVVLFALMALVIDVSWFWANTIKIQRAADAAAMAGAVWLPGNVNQAKTSAMTEAKKNGYTGCVAGSVCVTPVQDSLAVAGGNPNQLDVTVTAPVPTFFMRVFGVQSFMATRTAKAVYVQKLPMGSPLNYYGVYQDCKVSGSSVNCADLPNATGLGTLTSQGFFGAIEGQGANRATGDAFATAYNPDGSPPVANDAAHSGGLIVQQYDPNGYEYLVTVTANNSTLYVYDPTFCATTSGPGGGHLGAGDHWLSTANHNAPVAVSTYFRLFNTQNTLFTTADDGPPVADSLNLFKNELQIDKSAAYSLASAAGGLDNNFSDGTEPTVSSTTNCAAGVIPAPVQTEGRYWHNQWWPMATGLAAGTYRLQVTTTDPNNATLNQNQAFENMWSLEIVGGGLPTIAGSGRMVTYANIQSGSQLFYLSQIDRTAAGKTLEIDLFDPGDVGDKAWLQIYSPDGNVYTPATFNWKADSANTSPHTTGQTGVSCIQTYGNNTAITPPAGCDNYTSGGQFFQNSWIQITIVLPAGYGSTGLTPCPLGVCEPAAGWWKVKYTVNKGNDTTTWMVSLRGNPVHLVVP
jgi:Flp pilus assembly protein TadG